MKTLGIITYYANHLKTEQLLLRLAGRHHLNVYALPYTQRPSRKVLFSHRPNQSAAAHPGDICAQLVIPYFPVKQDREIDGSCELYLIAGAGILSAECLRGKRILNGHPGVIPAARGLDAFKWSIYNGLPLGVTLHYIDRRVDAGEIVSVIPTPVFASDTLETLARRHYENEIYTLAHFEESLRHPCNPFPHLPQGAQMRRMGSEQERELAELFALYKQRVFDNGQGWPGRPG